MTAQIFVDAVAWIAILNTRDSLHQTSVSTLGDLRQRNSKLITSEFVLLEVANALSSPDFRARVAVFIDGLRQYDYVEIVEASSELFSAGMALYRGRPDKSWSLVDCTSFAVMTERRISSALTEDRHFEQAGFAKLL